MSFSCACSKERERTGEALSLRSLLVLDALKRQRRLTVAGLSSQLHMVDAVTRAIVEALVEAGLVEARGSLPARSYILSSKVYVRSGKGGRLRPPIRHRQSALS